MTCHVRDMTAADRVAVAALCSQLGYPSTAEQIDRRFARVTARPDNALLVAEQDAQVVGWIHVTIVPMLECDLGAEIMGLVVDDARRSEGIGAALLAAGETWAREHGCASIRVRSRIVRERAHAFYGRHGFACIKTQHAFEKSL